MAEGGHLFIYQLPLPMLKHDGAAFPDFHSGTNSYKAELVLPAPFPLTSQVPFLPEVAAGKIGGQRCVLATLP